MSALTKTTDVATTPNGQVVDVIQWVTNYTREISERASSMEIGPGAHTAEDFFELLTSGCFAYLGTGQLSLNLAAFVQCDGVRGPCFDPAALAQRAYSALRFLDDIAVIYADTPVIRVDGLSEALMKMGVRYNSVEGRRKAVSIIRQVRDEVFNAAIRVTFERGSHPEFDAKHYVSAGYGATLPSDLRKDVLDLGLRFPTVLTIGNDPNAAATVFRGVTPGIMPAPAWVYHWSLTVPNSRLVEVRTTNMMFRLLDGRRPMPEHYVVAKDLQPVDYELMLNVVAKLIDGGIEELPEHFMNLLKRKATNEKPAEIVDGNTPSLFAKGARLSSLLLGFR